MANILVVDDTPEALKLLKDVLNAEGFRVRPFNNGELALRSAAAEAPDLVLLDVRMPGMDGFEVCRRLKQMDSLVDVPVIFISAADEVEDKIRGFRVGGVDYITKPFQKEEVIARVRTHVELHQFRRKLQDTADALRRSEESLKIAQHIAHLGHWEWEMASGEMRWSDETFRILGYEPGKVTPSEDALFGVIHPEDREAVMTQCCRTQDGDEFDIEYRIVLPDGRVRVVHGIGKEVSLGGTSGRVIATIQDITDHRPHEMLGVIQDITERKQLEQRLEAEAHTDALTGCLTRRRFLELARQELTRVHRYGGTMSLLMLDLDHFKVINDRNGHAVGDSTLKTLVRTCQETLRTEDIVGRLGGEEFAVLLPETDCPMAEEVGRRLLKSVAESAVPTDGGSIHFTTSIGVASLTLEDVTIEMLLERADLALYAAKHAGRNTLRVAVQEQVGESQAAENEN